MTENVELLFHTLPELNEEHEKSLQAAKSEELSTTPTDESVAEYKESRLGQNEERFQKLDEKLKQLAKDMKKDTSDRIEYLIQESDDNAKSYAELWQLRENYRLDVEKKNQSLEFLLNKTKEAIQTCRDIDNPPVDNKKKKK